MPLARVALYGKGVELYIAPTADSRDAWQATMQHIALEGRCFVLGCNQYVTKSMYPEDLRESEELAAQPEEMCRGGSVILSPRGEVLAGPLFGEEGMLVADLDRSQLIRAKLDFDVVGHYARPDVFELRVNEMPRDGVCYDKSELHIESQSRADWGCLHGVILLCKFSKNFATFDVVGS